MNQIIPMKAQIVFFLTISFSLFTIRYSHAQTPTWLDSDKRKTLYPNSKFFTGVGEAILNRGESMDENRKAAESDAKQDLIESIQVTVESIAIHKLSEQNQEIRESYRQAVSSFSKIKLPGIKDDTHFDKKKKITYAFAWVSKQELAQYYQDQLDLYASQLETKLSEAQQLYTNGQKQKALEAYQECFPILRQMEEALAMLVTIGIDPEGKLPGTYQTEISENISKISQNANLTLDEMCQLLAGSIKAQLGKNENTLRLVPFTYEDTRMASKLSARFGTLLEAKLVAEGLKMSVLGTEGIQNSLILIGTYWEDEVGDYLKFIASVKDLSTGTTLASAENRIPKSWLDAAMISWKPENYEEALSNLKLFTKDEVIGGGLKLDVWTNRGDENLLFREGETMKLFIRVNHECYLRFIYYLADGTKTLLRDNYPIPSDMVNIKVLLIGTFTCDAPFGVETLQVIAQTVKFPRLNTYIDDNGYEIILDDTKEIMRSTRGMKRNNDQLLFGEKRLVITTIP